MRRVAISCGVIGLAVATAGPGLAVTLNVSVGSSVDRTFFAGGDTDTIFTVRNQSRTAVAACCFYVNRRGQCANAPAQVCFGKNNCGPRDTCINGCSDVDFRFELAGKSHAVLGDANVVEWSAQAGLLAAGIPPIADLPFFGDLLCDVVGVADPCPAERPCP